MHYIRQPWLCAPQDFEDEHVFALLEYVMIPGELQFLSMKPDQCFTGFHRSFTDHSARYTNADELATH